MIPEHLKDQAKKADGKIDIIELCTGTTADGEAFYAYISIPPGKYPHYKEMLMSGATLDLTAYGEVLEAGPGREPAPDIKKKMAEKYGLDDSLEAHLLKAILKK